MFFDPFDDSIESLSERQCQALLASRKVGRVSLSIRALPAVVPVNYQYVGGDVIIGTRNDLVRQAVVRQNIIALGIDNADLTDAFCAVLVIGRAAEVTDPDKHAQFQTLGLAAATGMSCPHYLRLRPDFISGYQTLAIGERVDHETLSRGDPRE